MFVGDTVTLSDGGKSLTFTFSSGKLINVISYSSKKNNMDSSKVDKGATDQSTKPNALKASEFSIYLDSGERKTTLKKACGYYYSNSERIQSKRGMLIGYNTFFDVKSAYSDVPKNLTVLSNTSIAIHNDKYVLIFNCNASDGIIRSITSETLENYKKNTFIYELQTYGTVDSPQMQKWVNSLTTSENDLVKEIHGCMSNSLTNNSTYIFSVSNLKKIISVEEMQTVENPYFTSNNAALPSESGDISTDSATPSETADNDNNVNNGTDFSNANETSSETKESSLISRNDQSRIQKLANNFFKNYNFPIAS